MTALETLHQIPQLFRYADVQKFTSHSNVFLTRALRKNLIIRIARGVYVNSFLKNLPSVEEVACFLRTPSYISCEWALNRHGVLIQSPKVCTVITLSTAVGQTRRLAYQGVEIEFSHIAPRLFSGYETREGFNIALPEKALLDAVYLRKAIPFPDELEMDALDVKRLRELAGDYPLRTRQLLNVLNDI
jgi:predicted transcriptional regulator of viral defense system